MLRLHILIIIIIIVQKFDKNRNLISLSAMRKHDMKQVHCNNYYVNTLYVLTISL